ncbi:hypothetical protein TRFO_04661 [Tritrichomonas foetus]|uniref:VIT domain-containing protein n=1 Tax=Tritrichomonas foetus TaxID=1144522 RepID=A0A1J4KDM3_9EUKA|nr:hypothetical protein TRFO_04661 [Tritrichomonas foetus]|eukprot:OHT09082.1 hypothetical protein TRFO_04661 [Tritrichomonas foetus]
MKASLITGEGQPVQELRITGHIKDGICRAAFKGTFENKLDHPIETSFTFPLPQGVCSTQFKVNFGGTKVTSRVARDDNARIEYDDTLAQSDFAAMAQVNDKNEIRIDIGTLAPKETCKIALYFVIALNPLSNGFLLVLPTSITSFSENLRLGLTPPPLKLHLDITDSLSKIKSITTPFNKNTQIDLSKGEIKCDELSIFSPLHVFIQFEEKNLGRCLYQKIDGNTFLNVVATTPRTIRDHPSQFTVMYENGSSLTGGQISLLMRALEFFILSIPHGCKFNYVNFGFDAFTLFDVPLILDNDKTKQALACLKRQHDPYSKTIEFIQMHDNIINNITDADEVESVIVIIGSSLPNEFKPSPNHNYFLLDPFTRGDFRIIAQEKGACYIPVADESSLIASLLSVIKMTATAEIENVKLCVGDEEFKIPPVIPGYTFSTLLLLDKHEEEDNSKKNDSTDKFPDVKLTFADFDLILPTIESPLPIIHHLWAFEKMKTAAPEEKAALALANQILTPDTSSVVVVERDEEVEGEVSHVDSRLSRIGIGWIDESAETKQKDHNHDDDEIIHPQPMPIPHPLPHPLPHPFPHPLPRPRPFVLYRNPRIREPVFINNNNNLRRRTDLDYNNNNNNNNNNIPNHSNENKKPELFVGSMKGNSNTTEMRVDILARLQQRQREAQEKAAQRPPGDPKAKKLPFFLLRVLQLQNADGSWTNEKFLANSCGFSIPTESRGLKREQFMTAFIIACIRRKAPADEEKYELVIEKALTFLIESDPAIDWDTVISSIDADLQ